MNKIIVKGGKPLIGEVQISGAKNAILPIATSALLATEGKSTFYNVPNLSDVKIMCSLFESLGAKTNYYSDKNILEIDARNKLNKEASFEYVAKMRASFLVIGPILAREKKARVSMPGGCAIGNRPTDQHEKGFMALGASIKHKGGYIEAEVEDNLKGTNIFLDFPSVGATQNIIMASCLAKGTTTIENAAQEPEIGDLIDYLNKMGAKIKGRGTSYLKIEGVEKLVGTEHTIMPDRVEAATYMVAAAATKGDVFVKDAKYCDNVALVSKLREMGVKIEISKEGMRVSNKEEFLKSIDIKTLPHPGFLTDMQSITMVLTLLAKGVSTIDETIFENRFMHVEELRRMGANIKATDRSATIQGPAKLQGTNVKATDLRAGAALIIAGLVAEGETTITNIHHIDRGYVDIEKKLTLLGANIERVE